MRGSSQDLPVTVDIPEGRLQQSEWGDHAVELGTFTAAVDPAPLFAGLPNDQCQAPHWGYVIRGRLLYRYLDHDEVYEAGDAYYAPPGHTPFFEAGVQYVEFSPLAALAETMAVVERNMQAAG